MKTKLLVIISLLSYQAFSQTPIDNGSINYSGVDSETVSTKDAYLIARKWFLKNFNDENAKIILDDAENFQLVGKGILIPFYDNLIKNGIIQVTFKISFKQNKYKYEFTDLIAKYYFSDGTSGLREMPLEKWINISTWNPLFEKINNQIINLASDIKNEMNKKDNW